MRYIIYLITYVYIIAIAPNANATDDIEGYLFQKWMESQNNWSKYQQEEISNDQETIQSDEKTIQSYIQTESELQRLQKARYEKEEALYKKQKAQYDTEIAKFDRTDKQFQEPDFLSLNTEEQKSESLFSSLSFSSEQEKNNPEPYFVLNAAKMFFERGKVFVQLEVENIGDKVDAIVTITSKDGVIIGKPYFQKLEEGESNGNLTFMLRQKTDKLTVKIDASGKSFKIPFSLPIEREGSGKSSPIVNVQPFSQKVRIGDSCEYFITLEAEELPEKRYQLQTLNLPEGISSTFVLSEKAIPVSEVKFTASKKIINLILRLSISANMKTNLIGKPLPFLVCLSTDIVEQLTITPLGLGKITIKTHVEEVKLPLDKEKDITVTIENIGTVDIPELEIFTQHTSIGISTECSPKRTTLSQGEKKEIKIAISAYRAKIGRYVIKIIAQQVSSELLEEVPLYVKVTERDNLLFSKVFRRLEPILFIAAIVVSIGAIYVVFTFRKKAEPEIDEEIIEEEWF